MSIKTPEDMKEEASKLMADNPVLFRFVSKMSEALKATLEHKDEDGRDISETELIIINATMFMVANKEGLITINKLKK